MAKAATKKKAAKEEVVPTPSEPVETVVSYKGFDKDFRCRGFQFEAAKTYEHTGDVIACESGFHACEHPLHVLRYYNAGRSRFARVTQSGKLSRNGGDTKVASAKITIDAEIKLPDIIASAVKWVFDRAKWADGVVATEKNEGAQASGYSGAATASGDSGAATASGDSGAATASGYSGAATASGDSGAATASGYSGAATASGASGAATASGASGAATASGASGAATASGDSGAATASGASGRVKGADGCALFLAERSTNGKIIAVWAGIAGRDGIKADTWYSLKSGEPVEV